MPGFTRQIILQTLTELMNEKPLSKITVKDIVERCGVNRNTFYYHFRDIPDAVEAVVKEELEDILKNQKSPESVSDCMEILVNAVQKNKKAMLHLYRSIQRDVFADYLDHASESVVEELVNRVVGEYEMDPEDRRLVIRYVTSVWKCFLREKKRPLYASAAIRRSFLLSRREGRRRARASIRETYSVTLRNSRKKQMSR